MSELSFWNQWRKPYRNIYLVLLLLLVFAVVFLLFALLSGNSFAYSWEVLQSYIPYEIPLKSIRLLGEEIPLNVEHYLVEETFQGSLIKIFPDVYAALAILSFLFLSVAVGILSTLSRFWYLFGMTIVAFILAGLRFEQLMLFNSTENFGLYIAIVLYLPLSYYYNSINKSVSLFHRILSFLGVSLTMGLLIYFFSAVDNAFVYIGTYGILVPLMLSLLFIFLVSHDIISGFLNIITSGNTPNSKNSLLHYALISALYLGWLLLTYLHNINYVNWDIIYINPAVLLVISALVGMWEFRYRCGFVYPFVPYYPSGGILYLCLGLVSLATLGTFYLLANDPMLGMYEDFIIFSHLGVGFMFFIYTIGNFAGVLQKNYSVYKVLYKPKNLPYLTTSVGGIIIIGILVARSILYPYYQGLAGYYNVLGDLFSSEEQLFLSEQYYKLARSFDVTNHRSNYSLASLALKQGDEAVALKYFNDAIKRFPNEYSYANLANIYQEKGRFFDALFILNTGLEKFPGNPYLQNNLGLLYSGSSVLDSAMYYLESAGVDDEVKNSADINLLTIYIQNAIGLNADSMAQKFRLDDNLPLINNKLIYLNQQKVPLIDFVEKDVDVARRELDSEAFTFWHEYTLNQQYNSQSNGLDTLLSAMAADSTNQNFQSELLFLSSISQYNSHRVWTAFQSLKDVSSISTSGTGFYNYVLGIWALEQRSYRLALGYFMSAITEGYKVPAYIPAILNAGLGNIEDANLYLDQVLKNKEGSLNRTAYFVKQWLVNSDEQAPISKDSLAYISVYFNQSSNVPDLLGIASNIVTNSLQTEAYIDIIEKALENNDLAGINSLIDLLERRPLNEQQKKDFVKLRVEYWLATNQSEKIENLLNDSLAFSYINGSPLLVHFQAQKAIKEGNIEEGRKLFNQLAFMNPFYEQGLKDAVSFFNLEKEGEEKAYQILLRALNLNPYAVSLHKEYILQSLRMQLFTYSDNSLEELKELTSVKDYEKFLDLYNQKRDSLEQVQNQWD